MSEISHFKPFPLFSGCHFQTIVASLLMFYKNPSSQTEYVELSDGDKLAMEVYTPKDWQPNDLTVLMIHGYSGSHKSPYLIRMTKKLAKLGIRSIRLNMRGCGSGRGHAKKLYHGGISEDVLSTLKMIKQTTPDSPIVLIGFSIGGNIILKLAGELQDTAHQYISRIIAINPPMDLHESAKRLSMKRSRFYQRMFLHYLRSEIDYRNTHFDDLKMTEVPKQMSVYDLDEKYIIPQWGFSNVLDYYKTCSSKYYISRIEVPCHILLSKDDPIIDYQTLDDIDLPKNVDVHTTEEGGHLGFLGRPSKRWGFYWMDSLLLNWVQKEFNTGSDAS